MLESTTLNSFTKRVSYIIHVNWMEATTTTNRVEMKPQINDLELQPFVITLHINYYLWDM